MRELTREEIQQVHGGLAINTGYPIFALYGEIASEQASSPSYAQTSSISDMFQF